MVRIESTATHMLALSIQRNYPTHSLLPVWVVPNRQDGLVTHYDVYGRNSSATGHHMPILEPHDPAGVYVDIRYEKYPKTYLKSYLNDHLHHIFHSP